jgi:hypothetical protein
MRSKYEMFGFLLEFVMKQRIKNGISPRFGQPST